MTLCLISELEYRKLDIGERNMCKALDDLERIRLEEGEAQGFARGEAQGFTKGEAQGLAKGKEKTVFELRRKGNLSLKSCILSFISVSFLSISACFAEM